jgi:hypothetical protein
MIKLGGLYRVGTDLAFKVFTVPTELDGKVTFGAEVWNIAMRSPFVINTSMFSIPKEKAESMVELEDTVLLPKASKAVELPDWIQDIYEEVGSKY